MKKRHVLLSVKCFEHIFEPTPNELAGGMVTAEPCIMSSLLRRHIRDFKHRRFRGTATATGNLNCRARTGESLRRIL